MAIKKVTPKPRKKTVVAKVKKVVAPQPVANFPVKTFVLVSVLIFVFAIIFLSWWGFLGSINNNATSTDSNAWIYSRHKFDKYRAANCGGDPLITLPQCPRVQ